MIEERVVEELVKRFQTSEQNVIREYCQHLFLSNFYKADGAQKVLFKGGTAFRVIWGSPRFSEDLDFSGFKIRWNQIETLIEEALLRVEQSSIQVDVVESKQTTGGYLAIVKFLWNRFSTTIQIEISLRPGTSKKSNIVSIANDYIPDYTLLHLDEEVLVREKIEAILTRKKPRDFFDLYFVLRKRLAFERVFNLDKTLKKKVLMSISNEELDLRKELKVFLPTSHHGLLKNFREILEKEIERNLP